MSDELLAVGKEVEKTRKLAREVGMRGEKGLLDCEALVDKACLISSFQIFHH